AGVSGDRGAHGGARTVGADHEVRLDLEPAALGIRPGDARSVGLGAVDPVHRDAEAQVLAGVDAGGDEVAQHLVLRVEPDAAADQTREVDAVPLAGETQLDAV